MVVALAAVGSISTSRVDTAINIGEFMDARQVGLICTDLICDISQRKAHFAAVLIHMDHFPIGPP